MNDCLCEGMSLIADQTEVLQLKEGGSENGHEMSA